MNNTQEIRDAALGHAIATSQATSNEPTDVIDVASRFEHYLTNGLETPEAQDRDAAVIEATELPDLNEAALCAAAIVDPQRWERMTHQQRSAHIAEALDIITAFTSARRANMGVTE